MSRRGGEDGIDNSWADKKKKKKKRDNIVIAIWELHLKRKVSYKVLQEYIVAQQFHMQI